MKQKKQFIAPKAKVQKCDVAGIICASGEGGSGSAKSFTTESLNVTSFDW